MATPTRFELELEFITCLSSPTYLNHLASTSLFNEPSFIAYLSYLQYWSEPPYIHYLRYPGPSLRALELLQTEAFRKAILAPGWVDAWAGSILKGVEVKDEQEA